MAKYALIHKDVNRVNQVVDSITDCFDVHTDLRWIECPDDVTQDYKYENGEFVKIERPMTNYQVARKVGYGEIGEQLGTIYDGIAAGNDASSTLLAWTEKQTKIKALFPKDNPEATQAAQDECSRRQTIYIEECELTGAEYTKNASAFVLEVAEDFISGKWNNPITGPYKG